MLNTTTALQFCDYTYMQPLLHQFNSLFSKTTWVSCYQRGRTTLNFTEARDDRVAVASAGPYANQLHIGPDR